MNKIWEDQQKYNAQIRRSERHTHEEWVQLYALGMMEEISELLRAETWKGHREPKSTKQNCVPWELADLTKYVMSLWQQYGFSLEEASEWVDLKNDFLRQMQWQENKRYNPAQRIYMFDMDGVLADFRTGFIGFLLENRRLDWRNQIEKETPLSIHMDITAGWASPEYQKAKFEFEMTAGGYQNLPSYPLADLLGLLESQYIVVVTARPRSTQVIADSWRWLRQHKIQASEYHIGEGEHRLSRAQDFLDQDKQVILFDDDPTMLVRARSVKGLNIVRVAQPYNRGIPADLVVDPMEDVNHVKEMLEELWPTDTLK